MKNLLILKIAKVIADETNAQLLILHGAHNLSKEELESGITYIEIMEGNLERLLIGFKMSKADT